MRDKSEKAKGPEESGLGITTSKRQKSLRQPTEGGGVPNSIGTEARDDSFADYLPKLTVRTRKKDSTDIIIEFEDNGPGIPDNIKDKILQPFFTTKKGTAGTGLGMSITHDIVKAHNGKIAIESKQGEGTTVTITLGKE